MTTRSGGRYLVRGGEPVLVERSGHKGAVTPAKSKPAQAARPVAESPKKEPSDAQDTKAPAAGRS